MSTIEGFFIMGENYDAAITLLENQSGSKDILINTRLSKLLSIQPLRSSDNVKSFRKTFDKFKLKYKFKNSGYIVRFIRKSFVK